MKKIIMTRELRSALDQIVFTDEDGKRPSDPIDAFIFDSTRTMWDLSKKGNTKEILIQFRILWDRLKDTKDYYDNRKEYNPFKGAASSLALGAQELLFKKCPDFKYVLGLIELNKNSGSTHLTHDFIKFIIQNLTQLIEGKPLLMSDSSKADIKITHIKFMNENTFTSFFEYK